MPHEEIRVKGTYAEDYPCPHCLKKTHWQAGPSGSLCQNFRCARCHEKINVGPGWIEKLESSNVD